MGRNRNIPEFLLGTSIDSITKKTIITEFLDNTDINISNKNNLVLERFEIDISLYKIKKIICYLNTYVIFDYNKEKNFKNMAIHYLLKDLKRS